MYFIWWQNSHVVSECFFNSSLGSAFAVSNFAVKHKSYHLQSVTKIVRLAPSVPLFNVGCKFALSFLATTAWHSFSRLGTTLNQEEGEFWVSLSSSNIFLGVFYENIVSRKILSLSFKFQMYLKVLLLFHQYSVWMNFYEHYSEL